ncbi:MAG: aspartate aminotransferase family protein [Promethearchaeia archaeon]
MKNNPKNEFIGTLSQRELLKLYKKHVNAYKVMMFKGFGFGVIPGERHGIRFKTLEGQKSGDPPLEIINCRSSGGVFNLGHHNEIIVETLKKALDAGLDLGDHMLLSEWRAKLGKKLADLLPGNISKVTFGVSGGEAIDTAIKFSFAYTKKCGCISAIGGYHGHTGFALATGDPHFKTFCMWAPPGFKQVPFGDEDALRKAVDDNTACVIFETIPATGGVLIAPEGYFAEVREICDDNGIMMIIDEVQAGLGRTGEFWGIYGGLYPNEKVIPDFIVLGKGMSAGIYPLSACCYKPFIERAVYGEDAFIHISTTGGSDLACVIAHKMLEIQSDPKFLNHVKKMGKIFGEGLLKIAEENQELIKEARGRGLMWGVEFHKEADALRAMVSCIKEGILLNYCGNKEDTLIIMPPLIVKENEIEEIISKISTAIKNIK